MPQLQCCAAAAKLSRVKPSETETGVPSGGGQACMRERSGVQVVSRDIRRVLTQRADHFNIVLDDVSITQLTFGREYTHAIEAKQVAQQEAERAKFIVSAPSSHH